MFPLLFEIEWVAVPSWHVLFAVAALVAYTLLHHLNKARPFASSGQLAHLFLCIYAGGYFGARTFAIVVEEPSISGFADFVQRLSSLGPMTFYGGFLGAIACAILYVLATRSPKIDFATCWDACMLAGLLALAIGRIGCFLNGDDFGLPISYEGSNPPWWSVTFPNHENPIPRYPVQLYEMLYCLFLVATGYAMFVFGSSRPGGVALSLGSGYALCRFFIEFFRGDFRGPIGAFGFSPAQWISIGILILCNSIFIILELRGSPVRHPGD